MMYRVLYPSHNPSEMSDDQLCVSVAAALTYYQEQAFAKLLAQVDRRLEQVSYMGYSIAHIFGRWVD